MKRLKIFRRIIKENNEGVSLVELLVAIAVGAIVSASIAGLIVITTRMYSNESTNIAGQHELQTTLNQTVDSAESAQWFTLSQEMNGSDVVNTKYAAFGKLKGAAGALKFEGEIFTDNYTGSGKFNVYMNRYSDLAVGSETNADSAISGAADTIRGKEQYLLGEGATKYVVALDTSANRFTTFASAVDGYNGCYENPLAVKVSIEFTKKSMTGEVTKHVEDMVSFRNRIDKTLFVNSKKYYLKGSR